MIVCEIHSYDIPLLELVVTIREDAMVLLDRKNIGLPMEGGKPSLTKIEEMIAARIPEAVIPLTRRIRP